MSEFFKSTFELLIKSGVIYFVAREIFANLRASLKSRSEETLLSKAFDTEIKNALEIIEGTQNSLTGLIQANVGKISAWTYNPGMRPIQTAVFDSRAADILRLLVKYDPECASNLYPFLTNIKNYNSWLKTYQDSFMAPVKPTYSVDPTIHLEVTFKSMSKPDSHLGPMLEEAMVKIQLGSKWAQLLKKRVPFKIVSILFGLFLLFIPDRDLL